MKMKMKTKQRFFAITALVAILTGIAGCSEENVSETKGTARVQFKLTDAPSLEYKGVYIDIQGMMVGVGDEFYDMDDSNPYYDGTEDGDIDNDGIKEIEWIEVPLTNPGLYNLLDYRNGKTLLLAGGEIPAGKINQVRLLLGSDSYVIGEDGKEYPLSTPSAQTSGLKFNLHETLHPNLMYSFVIDFDAARSVVKTGNDKFILKPVIRTYAETFGGSIKGVVIPADAVAYVQLANETDTLISLPETDGKFLFAGLQGSYGLTVVTDTLSEYADTTIVDIAAENGVVIDLDTIRLIPLNQ